MLPCLQSAHTDHYQVHVALPRHQDVSVYCPIPCTSICACTIALYAPMQVMIAPSALAVDGDAPSASIEAGTGNKAKMKNGVAVFKDVRISATVAGSYTLRVSVASRKVRPSQAVHAVHYSACVASLSQEAICTQQLHGQCLICGRLACTPAHGDFTSVHHAGQWCLHCNFYSLHRQQGLVSASFACVDNPHTAASAIARLCCSLLSLELSCAHAGQSNTTTVTLPLPAANVF